MFTPSELEGIPLEIAGQFSALEQRIMEDIIRRIKINGEITRSADWQIHRLHELGESKRVIKKYIADTLGLDKKEINHIYKDVIRRGYERDESIYKYKGKPMIPFNENLPLQQLIYAVSAQTLDAFKNITGTMGFAVKQGDKVVFTELSDYYQRTLDGAMLDITTGAFDYNTVLRRITKELTNSGLRTVDYASGRSIRIESAARTAVMTGVSQVTAHINLSNAEQLGTDLFEVTWHSGARPTHQVWQGRVYTLKELEDICGYGLVTGLCGANCYHDFYPFIEGISERIYTDEELEELNRQENTPVEFNGRQYTRYEATQRQRYLERKMRAQRQEINLLQKGGASEDEIINARCRYRGTSSEYTRFSKAMNLPQQRERVTVDGLGNIGVGRYKNNNKLVSEENIKITKKNMQNGYSVNRQVVNSKEFHDKFENLTPHKSTNEQIYQQAKIILENRDGTNTERMTIIKSRTGELIVTNLDDCRDIQYKTGLTEEQYNKVLEANCKFIIIHNHPEGKRPSGTDILNLWREKNATDSIVVGHDGSVYSVSNINRKIPLDKIYEKAYNNAKRDGFPDSLARIKATDEIYKTGSFDFMVR